MTRMQFILVFGEVRVQMHKFDINLLLGMRCSNVLRYCCMVGLSSAVGAC